MVLGLTVLAGGLAAPWLGLTAAQAAAYWRAVPDYLIRNLTLFSLRYDLPGIFAANPYGPAINGSLWTLAHEVTCYAGVFLAGVAGLIGRPRLAAPALVAVALFYVAARLWALPYRFERLAELALPFAIGAGFWIRRHRVPLSLPLALGLGLAAAALRATPLSPPAMVLALAYATFVLGYARIPGLAAYRRLGDYSYGMYVYAFPMQQLVAATGIAAPIANIALALPATLVCAVLSWHIVEAPALRLGRRVPVS